MPDTEPLDELVHMVRENSRYRYIDENLVRKLGADELGKRRNLKEAVKATRSKLHQVGGAYQETPVNYREAIHHLQSLPRGINPETRSFCLEMMRKHASTQERIPFLDQMYPHLLERVPPFHTILDLACGLNPLAIPWMNLSDGIEYHAYDIYEDMLFFLNAFFEHCGVNGKATLQDLTQSIPAVPAELALVMKTLPCLEQIQKGSSARLLEQLQAETILISYPIFSLGGRAKGMGNFYEGQFLDLVKGKSWEFEKLEYGMELIFIVKKH